MINAIVACDENNGIGKNNTLPWNTIVKDLQHFQKLTQNSIVAMGIETYLSIPLTNRPLKNRINIILSRTPTTKLSDEIQNIGLPHKVMNFIDFSNEYLKKDEYKNNIFIIGGEVIYKLFEPFIEHIYLTKINHNFKCDKFFRINLNKFEKKYESEDFFCDNNKVTYKYIEYSFK